MPIITQLEIVNFRNIITASIDLHENFNIFYGENGSGKTSILEAIYYLGMGKSFRTNFAGRSINDHAESLRVLGYVKQQNEQITVGIERRRNSLLRMRIDKRDANSVAELAKILPLQILHPDSYYELFSSPKARRKFMDWGLFHVEHDFLPLWRQMNYVLKQRNAALKNHGSRQEVESWDHSLVMIAEKLDFLRQRYINKFSELLQFTLREFLGQFVIEISYESGWNREFNLAEILVNCFYQDRKLGYTQHGPHKADLRIHLQQIPIQDVLSQGQLKLLIYAFSLTQGFLLWEVIKRRCIYLLDDLPAELDGNNRLRVIGFLQGLGAQIFITGIDKPALQDMMANNSKLFHVEHGKIITAA